jgi:hypothetical protein
MSNNNNKIMIDAPKKYYFSKINKKNSYKAPKIVKFGI